MKSKAPEFIIKRMEALKRRPPPTPEQVSRQIAAAVAFRKRQDTRDIIESAFK